MSFVRLAKQLGILPPMLLYLRPRKVRFFRFESDDGIWPVKLLVQKKISVTLVRFPSHIGNAPVKLQFYEFKVFLIVDYTLITKNAYGSYHEYYWIVGRSRRVQRDLKLMMASHHQNC